MKKVIFILALLQLIVFPIVGYSQNSPSIFKKESKKDKIWLVPSSFGQKPIAFHQTDQQPYVSPEDFYHPPSIKPGPWVRYEPDTINNKDVFLGHSPSHNWFLNNPIGEIDKDDTSTWFAVLELCMFVLVSPVELEY